MRRYIPLVVFATACSGVGADLEIRSDRDLDRVELFIATEGCVDPDDTDEIDPCVEGVGWSPSVRRPQGLVLHMVDPLVIETELSDPRTAVIHLEVAGEAFQPMAIAIVGYAGGTPVVAAELRDITIPVDEAVRLAVDLVDVGSADGTGSAPEADAPQTRVHVWPRRGHGPDHVGCAVYQTWLADKGEWKTHYYGPLDDPDCDNHEIECDKYWFDRNVGARQGCLFDLFPTKVGGCRLGATTCEDGASAEQGCAIDPTGQSNHCFDDALCAECEGAANLEACVIEQVTSSAVAGIACAFTPDLSFLPCTGSLTKSVFFAIPDGCIGTDNFRLRLLQDDPLGLTTAGSTTIVVDGVTITGRVEPGMGACKMILEWQAGSAAMHPGADLMLDVWYPFRHLFLPVHIEFTSPAQCTTPTLEQCDPYGRMYTTTDLDCLR